MKTTNAVLEGETELNSSALTHAAQANPGTSVQDAMASAFHDDAEPVPHDNLTLTSTNHDNLHDNNLPHVSAKALQNSNIDQKITLKPKNANLASGLSSLHLDLARQLLSSAVRKRRFRLNSFVARLAPEQLATLMKWIQEEQSILSIRDRVAAAPPEGFGIQVQTNTLYRLRNLIRNTEFNHWIANTMDATCDILDAETTNDTAPVREAISQLLHSRLMTTCRLQSDPASIDRLLSAITRLEKLKLLTGRHSRQDSKAATAECLTPATRHKVELSFSPHIPRSHQTPPPEGSGAEPQIHRYSIARDAESI